MNVEERAYWTTPNLPNEPETTELPLSVMETRAHGVLGGKIGRIKQSNVNPVWLADQLFAAKIIGEEDVMDAHNTTSSKAERREELMQLVMGSGKEGVFHTFVKILLSKEHLTWLGNEVKGV